MKNKVKVNKFRSMISTERVQIKALVIIFLIEASFTAILYISNPLSFQKFFGNVNPLIIIPLLVVLGIYLLVFLLSRSWFEIYCKLNLKGIVPFYILAIFLASIAILIDISFKYPEDTNILFP